MSVQTLEISRSSASGILSSGNVTRHPLPSDRFEAHRHVDLHRLQGLRGRLPGVERPRSPSRRTNDGDYQTLKTLDAQFWNLIRFDEREVDGGLKWLMRKDQCMHCAEPGCLEACPAPGAIVQYANGIVDVNPEQCIGCGYCETGCPFDVPKFHAVDGEDGQVHALRGPRLGRSRARVHQGLPDGVPPLRNEGRHDRARQPSRGAAQGERLPHGRSLRPQGRRRHRRRHGARVRRPSRVVRRRSRATRTCRWA